MKEVLRVLLWAVAELARHAGRDDIVNRIDNLYKPKEEIK